MLSCSVICLEQTCNTGQELMASGKSVFDDCVGAFECVCVCEREFVAELLVHYYKYYKL